jgi:8-oxo-dGTP diphosphatase
VLLVRFEFPNWVGWATPGGGLDATETHEEAIRRELAEEAGLEQFELGPPVWTRTFLFERAVHSWDGQKERFYLVRTKAFDPTPQLTWAQLNAEFVTAVRWWSLGELEGTDALFAPRRLPALVRELVAVGPPAQPVDVGI